MNLFNLACSSTGFQICFIPLSLLIQLVLLDVSRDDDLVVEVAWVLVYVTSMSDIHSSQLIHAGLLPPLVSRLALSRHLALLTPVSFPISALVFVGSSCVMILYHDVAF